VKSSSDQAPLQVVNGVDDVEKLFLPIVSKVVTVKERSLVRREAGVAVTELLVAGVQKADGLFYSVEVACLFRVVSVAGSAEFVGVVEGVLIALFDRAFVELPGELVEKIEFVVGELVEVIDICGPPFISRDHRRDQTVPFPHELTLAGKKNSRQGGGGFSCGKRPFSCRRQTSSFVPSGLRCLGWRARRSSFLGASGAWNRP
jgi:hypothetical protein